MPQAFLSDSIPCFRGITFSCIGEGEEAETNILLSFVPSFHLASTIKMYSPAPSMFLALLKLLVYYPTIKTGLNSPDELVYALAKRLVCYFDLIKSKLKDEGLNDSQSLSPY